MEPGDGLKGIEHVLAVGESLAPGGALFRHLIEQFPAVQRHNAEKMLQQVLDALAVEPEELTRRLEASPALRRVFFNAARAAADTDVEEKINGLARVSAQAAADSAAVDPAHMLVRTIEQLDPIDVRALHVIETPRPSEAINTSRIVPALGVSEGMGQAIVGHLIQLGLAKAHGATFTGLHADADLSDFGMEVLDYLRARADQME